MSEGARFYLDHVQFSGVELSSRSYNEAGLQVMTGATVAPAPRIAPVAKQNELNSLTKWLLARAGLDVRAYNPAPLLRRQLACLRHLRVKCPNRAIAVLDQEPHLVPATLDMLLIGVTEFFRDEAVFRLVRRSLIPELLRERDVVRVYSAGASTGEELYSIAILFAELDALERCELLGLDCRPDAIARARRGHFRAGALGSLEPPLREKYFRQAGEQWIVDERLQARIEWRLGDALEFSNLEPRDLILFRNVAIYLDQAYAAAGWSRLAEQLSPGGYLITGRAEQPSSGLPLQRLASSIYRRT